jgi:hypothetical protein
MLQKLNNRPFHPDDTDMRPYRPGRPFAPDKGDPFPGPFRDGRGGGNGGNGGGGGILSAFLPGQKDALAQQLANGFGGGNKQWKGILGQTYAPITSAVDFEYGGGVKGKNGGKGDGKKNPDDPNGGDDDGSMDAYVPDDEFGHQRAMLPVGLQQQMRQPVPQQMQMQQPQIQGQTMNPQMLMMLRQRLMGGR